MQCGQLRAMPELALSCMGNIPILVWQTCECCLIVTYTCFWLRFALRLDRSKNLYPVVIGPRWRISRRRKTSGTVCLWGGWRTAADVSSDGKSGRQDSECQEKGTRVFCGCLQQAVKEKGPFLCWPLQKPSQKVSTLLLQNLWSKQITGEERLCVPCGHKWCEDAKREESASCCFWLPSQITSCKEGRFCAKGQKAPKVPY